MRAVSIGSVLVALVLSVPALGFDEIRVTNWQAAPYWMPAPAEAAREAGQPIPENASAPPPRDLLAVPTPALAFTGITPCRVADTRNAGFPAGYGPPFMSGGVPRDFTITGRCGIPANAEAVSFNFTVVNPVGAGFLKVYPQGGAPPAVSTLNYVAGQVVANAAVVPLGATGAITAIPGVSGFDLLIDVNGYYAPPQGLFAHLIAVGAVSSGGFVETGFTNLGTWTSSRSGTGSYGIHFVGLRPGCAVGIPTPQTTPQFAGFVVWSSYISDCVTGNVDFYFSTLSPASVPTDGAFFFLFYGGSPVASPLASAAGGRTPSTCTFTAATGKEICE